MAANNKYQVVIIEEGLGNLTDVFYYTREALEGAVSTKLFEGKKCFADHPDAIESQTRPERSVKDIIGHFENTRIVNGVAGQAMLCADLVLIPSVSNDWSRTLIESSIGVSGKFDSELIGLSINASGASEKKPIDDFISGANIPISAQPKLQKAKAQGITDIEVCSALIEAVSVDLVTEAGAKGRILKLIESERNRMSKKVSPKKVKEDGAGGAPGAHADADQDKELIGSMLKKYLGEGEHSEEVHQAMQAAHKAAGEMGLEGEEAEKAAGYSMKMAKHAADKAAAAKPADGAAPAEETEETEESEESETEESATDAAGIAAMGKKGKEAKMEREIIKANAKIAALEAKVKESEIKEFTEKQIKESGLPAAAVKKLKESLGKGISQEEISDRIKLFKEAYGLGGSAGTLFVNPEKFEHETSTAISFADCVKQ